MYNFGSRARTKLFSVKHGMARQAQFIYVYLNRSLSLVIFFCLSICCNVVVYAKVGATSTPQVQRFQSFSENDISTSAIPLPFSHSRLLLLFCFCVHGILTHYFLLICRVRDLFKVIVTVDIDANFELQSAIDRLNIYLFFLADEFGPQFLVNIIISDV